MNIEPWTADIGHRIKNARQKRRQMSAALVALCVVSLVAALATAFNILEFL